MIRIFLILLPFMLLAQSDVHEIAKKIDALQEDTTLSQQVGYKVYDPFKRAKPLLAKMKIKPKPKVFKPIRVETILNNRALVNGKWVKKGSIIEGSKVIAVKKNAIIVRYEEKDVLIPQQSAKKLVRSKELIR